MKGYASCAACGVWSDLESLFPSCPRCGKPMMSVLNVDPTELGFSPEKKVVADARRVTYEIWSNESKRPEKFLTGYAPMDLMICSHRGTIVDASPMTLNRLWGVFNADDRPNGRLAHSLSVGDVVVIGALAHDVKVVGFELGDPTAILRTEWFQDGVRDYDTGCTDARNPDHGKWTDRARQWHCGWNYARSLAVERFDGTIPEWTELEVENG